AALAEITDAAADHGVGAALDDHGLGRDDDTAVERLAAARDAAAGHLVAQGPVLRVHRVELVDLRRVVALASAGADAQHHRRRRVRARADRAGDRPLLAERTGTRGGREQRVTLRAVGFTERDRAHAGVGHVATAQVLARIDLVDVAARVRE